MSKVEELLAEGRRLADAVTNAKSVGERTVAAAARMIWLRDNFDRFEELVRVQAEAIRAVTSQNRTRGYPTGGEWQRLVASLTAVENGWNHA